MLQITKEDIIKMFLENLNIHQFVDALCDDKDWLDRSIAKPVAEQLSPQITAKDIIHEAAEMICGEIDWKDVERQIANNITDRIMENKNFEVRIEDISSTKCDKTTPTGEEQLEMSE
ncbi:MAG: hypothetical protein NC124_02465 [Clostridium sp.]|nr:hypothetical protein [Clostridium sp.]